MGLPGLRGTEHIGLTVPDLDEADYFFVDVLGCERFHSIGPMRHDDSDWMERHLAVHPRTYIRRLAFYRCGFGVNLEVIEYVAADGQLPPPRNSDLGGHHVALYVDDMDAAIAYLRSRDVRVLDGPTLSSGGNLGQRWIYFQAPWGMFFELVSFPEGKAYERETERRLWHPGEPAR